MSHALHYGTSVFEGVRCYDSHLGPVVFRHREHMQRLHDSAKIYRMPVSQSVDELMEACRATLRKNNPGQRVHPPAGVRRRCRHGRQPAGRLQNGRDYRGVSLGRLSG